MKGMSQGLQLRDRVRHWRRLLWWSIGCLLMSGGVVSAAEPGEMPGALRAFPLERKPLPGPGLQEPPPSPAFELPPLPQSPAAQSPLSERVTVYVREIRLSGNTVLADASIADTIRPYVGREVTTADLQQLTRELTMLYIDNGYLTSGVVLPDQQVVNGVIQLQAIEGVLSAIALQGLDRLRERYVRQSLLFPADTPVNLDDLQTQLQLLKLDPNIDALNARLTPAGRLGQSVLTLSLTEAPATFWWAGVDNHRNPSIGALQGELGGGIRNIAGLGDVLVLTGNLTAGLREGSIGYALPLSATGPTLSVFYQAGKTEVVEAPFDEIDIESEFDEWSLQLSQPLTRSLSRDIRVTASLEGRHSETFLLGERFSFAPGVQDGNSRVTVLRLVADWSERRERQVFALRSTLSRGLDLFDATINDDAPDGRFLSWLLQLQYAQRFDTLDIELVARGDMQLAADPLLPLEKFGVGGAYSVRGYRENELVGDNGIASSLELRIPILRDRPEFGRWQFALFTDYGRSWDKGASATSISSAGLGLRWERGSNWSAELYGAVPFHHFDHAQHDLQDSGIHFAVGYHSR